MENQNDSHIDERTNSPKTNGHANHTNGSDTMNENSYLGGTHENGSANSTKMDDLKSLKHRSKSITTQKRCLGDLITTVNHIAITVSDVERSLWFYGTVMGFKQIRRPNFDRNGAWLIMGNIELHLLHGKPTVHLGEDRIGGHIALKSDNMSAVLARLKEMDLPFETDISVPEVSENERVVTSYFLRDPDGYYIEICNCGVL